MEELLNKPILNQMYEFKKECFEQSVYDKNDKAQVVEGKVFDIAEGLNKFLEKVIPDQEDYHKARKMLESYELEHSNLIDFWNCLYFKLGMTDREKIRNEFLASKIELAGTDTFFDDDRNDISEWLEEQKRKYTFGTKEYKELQKRYNEISEQYPNVMEVFENLTPIQLSKDEMKALVEIRDIDITMGSMEKKLCFKLGIKEAINF